MNAVWEQLLEHDQLNASLVDVLAACESISYPPVEDNAVEVLVITCTGDVHEMGCRLCTLFLNTLGVRAVGVYQVSDRDVSEHLQKYRPTAMMVTGFLSSSEHSMSQVLKRLAQDGIMLPIIFGGTVLHSGLIDQQFKQLYSGPLIYAKSGVKGVILVVNWLRYGSRLPQHSHPEKRRDKASHQSNAIALSMQDQPVPVPVARLPKPPDYIRHVRRNISIDTLLPRIHSKTLFQLHLGYRGSFENDLKCQNLSAITIKKMVDKVTEKMISETVLEPLCIWQWIDVTREDNHLWLSFNTGRGPIKWEFPRQRKPPYRSVVDYFSRDDTDCIGLSLVTVGDRMRDYCRNLFDKGQYTDMLIAHSVGMQCAEALADWLHEKMMIDLVGSQARSSGRRYSFGYSACPNLDGQRSLFDILTPEDNDIELTDRYMMTPEGSVSAFLVHHPEATYF